MQQFGLSCDKHDNPQSKESKVLDNIIENAYRLAYLESPHVSEMEKIRFLMHVTAMKPGNIQGGGLEW